MTIVNFSAFTSPAILSRRLRCMADLIEQVALQRQSPCDKIGFPLAAAKAKIASELGR